MPGPSLVYSLRSEGAMRQLLKRERQRQVSLVKKMNLKLLKIKLILLDSLLQEMRLIISIF